VLRSEAVRNGDQAAARLSREGGDRGFDIRFTLHRHGDGFDRQPKCGRLDGAQIQSGVRRRPRIVNDGDPHDPRIDFLQQLQHFATDRGLKKGEA
jgi:hypothetical protein